MGLSDTTVASAGGVIFWFRNDLRLHDQAALAHAIGQARATGGWLLPVHVEDPAQQATTRWGFERTGPHRRAWRAMAVQGLGAALAALGSPLLQLHGAPARLLPELAQRLGTTQLVCEDIPAPEEQGTVRELTAAGLRVEAVWQSTLLAPGQLPMPAAQVPDVFTAFRQAVEAAGVRAAAPLPRIEALPPRPDLGPIAAWLAQAGGSRPTQEDKALVDSARSSFPFHGEGGFEGNELAALAHLRRYCAGSLPTHYKDTRNGLHGIDFSTKWSPWLATGALSARQAWAAVAEHEATHGPSAGTGWIWFELLWRDHFRWLHRKHGARLYRAGGLTDLGPPAHDAKAFERWCLGRTGQPFIDAGMRELAGTGYLSNRMRQNVASYLVHDLGGDWRAGAAWFESRLIDYDVCSNQGNWLYLSGRGTDPRGQRRFDPQRQSSLYDPQGAYRQLWSAP